MSYLIPLLCLWIGFLAGLVACALFVRGADDSTSE